MVDIRAHARSVLAAALIGGLMCATAACGAKSSAASGAEGVDGAGAQSEPDWKEPSSYTYTLKSTKGERTLLGTYRVTVREHKVAKAVGLDESGRLIVKQVPDAVPTIGDLLKELKEARRAKADTAEVKYAADGHPSRISLDWKKEATDDEALYVISSYEPVDKPADESTGR